MQSLFDLLCETTNIEKLCLGELEIKDIQNMDIKRISLDEKYYHGCIISLDNYIFEINEFGNFFPKEPIYVDSTPYGILGRENYWKHGFTDDTVPRIPHLYQHPKALLNKILNLYPELSVRVHENHITHEKWYRFSKKI